MDSCSDRCAGLKYPWRRRQGGWWPGWRRLPPCGSPPARSLSFPADITLRPTICSSGRNSFGTGLLARTSHPSSKVLWSGLRSRHRRFSTSGDQAWSLHRFRPASRWRWIRQANSGPHGLMALRSDAAVFLQRRASWTKRGAIPRYEEPPPPCPVSTRPGPPALAVAAGAMSIDSPLGRASAVDRQDCSRDVAGVVREQESDGLGHILGLRHEAQCVVRRAGAHRLHGSQARRIHRPWGHGVDADALAAVGGGQALDQPSGPRRRRQVSVRSPPTAQRGPKRLDGPLDIWVNLGIFRCPLISNCVLADVLGERSPSHSRKTLLHHR